MVSKTTKGVVGFGLVFALVSGFEGYRSNTYRDVTGTPTVCYGETKGVKMGQVYTKEKCDEMLQTRLVEFSKGVDKCIKVPVTENTKAAMVSFAYNVGLGTFCKSSVVKYLNQGKLKEACDTLMRYTISKGKMLQGLKNRREKERALCLA